MRLSSTDAYRLWAPVYDGTPNPLLALEARLLPHCWSHSAGGTVLDVGCGTGRSMESWCDANIEVFGADLSMEMLRQASRKSVLQGRVVLAEAATLPFANEMADLTICSFAFSYFTDPVAACSEMSRVTKHSGSVVISDLHASAVSSGWSRSFRIGDRRYEIEHSIHSAGERDCLFSNSGLRKRKEISAGFSEHERPIFIRAGKGDLFEDAARIPAVSLAVYSKHDS